MNITVNCIKKRAKFVVVARRGQPERRKDLTAPHTLTPDPRTSVAKQKIIKLWSKLFVIDANSVIYIFIATTQFCILSFTTF